MQHLQVFVDYSNRDTCRITPKQLKFFTWKLKEAVKAHPVALREEVAARCYTGQRAQVETFYMDTTDPLLSENYLTVEIDTSLFQMYVRVGKEFKF